VISKIAAGGMAEIFLALQMGEQGFQKPVVLKRILPALAEDAAFVRMLVDEAHIASTLNHSNLVQVLDLGKSGGQYFLVLEFIDGWSLEQIRRRALAAKVKLPLPLALYIVSALCRGLAYVHTRERAGKPLGIVHRDVTPQNVLISQHGEVKLADFGIAKAVGKSERSATGVIKGKFAYMSPEQSAARPLDARSDLFSVGTLLYLLTTGKKPFDGATDTDVIMQVRRAKPEKPSTVVRDMNVDVERVINRALRADPGKRWQSAEQMADKLDAILIKLGQPSGPAPLKRWLETLSARDGAKPPVPDPALVVNDPSIAVSLGSIELELEEVPQPTFVEPDRGTNVETRPLRYRAPTPPPQLFEQAAAAAPPPRPSVVRFKRWARRLAIRAAIVVLALGGASYFAWPHLPAWIKRPISNWVSGVSVEFGPKSH
jgi:serine/threonine-protein kinase